MSVEIEEDEIDLKEIFRTLGKHKKKILFVTLLFTLLAVIYAYITPNLYSASTSIELSEKQKGMQSGDILSLAMGSETTSTNREIEIIKSRYLIRKVLKDLDMEHRYYMTSRYKKTELYKNSPFQVVLEKGKDIFFTIYPINEQSYRLEAEGRDSKTSKKWKIDKVCIYGESIETEYSDFTLYLKDGEKLDKEKTYHFIVREKNKVLVQIQQNLSVAPISNKSNILRITYNDPVALRAEEFTNALAEVYLIDEINQKTEEASRILDFIDKQLAGINGNLQDSENNLENFKQKSNMLSLGSKAENIVRKMSEYEGKLAEASIEEEMLNSLYGQIKKGRNIENISAAGLDLSTTGIPQLIQKLQEAVLKRKILRADYTAAHPEVRKLTQSISQTKKVIASTIKTLKLRVSKRKVLLKNTIEKYKGMMESLPEKEKIFGGLQRKFIVNEKIYSYLLEKRATTAIAKASTVNKSRIIDTALLPVKPIKPKRKLIVMVGFIFGMILGIALAFLLEFLDDDIKEEEDIRKLTDIPLLGSIPFIEKDKDSLKVIESPKSVVAEAFRALRTNLQFMTSKHEGMVVSLTSTIAEEGKTTVAANLAAIISLTGKKTVVLNLDMRKPTLHKKFDVSNVQGMSTLLSGKVPLEKVIQKSKYKNLDVIASGPLPPNPSELIGSETMLEVIEVLKDKYDVIILDTPPVGLVADAIGIMKLSDVSLYVVRSGLSKKGYISDIQRMAEKYEIKGFSLLLNGVKASKRGYGYGYGYYEEG